MIVQCKICNKEFYTKLSRIKDGRGKYCSRECYAKSCIGRSPAHKGKKISFVDGWYENVVRARKRFVGKNHPNWKGGKPKCIDCGKELSLYGYKNNRCRACYVIYNRGENHPMWRGGRNKKNESHYKQEYKRRKRGADGSFSLEEWEELKKKYNYMCLCCKSTEPDIKLEADHIIPISMGGSNRIENIQPLCRSCNARKWAKYIDYRQQIQELQEYSTTTLEQ